MSAFLRTPFDQLLAEAWQRADPSYVRAFSFVMVVNLIAFGFEMTNLTLHHDDLVQIFIRDTILGHYLGRFGTGNLHYYLQNAYFMPFVQMLEGMLFMTLYGLVIARLWGLQKASEITLVAAIVCVFPFMAQIYQYNTTMATYSVAHLLAASAVVLSLRPKVTSVLLAAALYTAAFSIYQSVLANAAAIFGIWLLLRLLFAELHPQFFSRHMLAACLGALIAVALGGALYLVAVSLIGPEFDSYQAADQAFRLQGIFHLAYAIGEVLHGSRAFWFWPENYFPSYLKTVQLLFVAGGALACLWLPRGLLAKITALTLLGLTLLAPRLLQVLHPAGDFHNLTLTGYAVVIAGLVAIVMRAAPVVLRNVSALLALFLIGGYVLQCNWISTVNHLNTTAHVATLTQILARVRSLPNDQWDGKTIAVLGRYDLRSDYPFRPGTGVATEFMGPKHMQRLARLLRDDASFIPASDAGQAVLQHAQERPIWPHPASVDVVDGVGLVVLSKDHRKRSRGNAYVN